MAGFCIISKRYKIIDISEQKIENSVQETDENNRSGKWRLKK
jgi:hypothetical protein